MNKKSATVMIFILILIVMFFLFPKSCGESPAQPLSVAVKAYKS